MITSYEEKFGFPKEASDCFEENFERIKSVSGAVELLDEALKLYFDGDTASVETILSRVSEESGVHRFTLDMIFLLRGLEPLSLIYKQDGYSEELFVDTMRDLEYKLRECRQIYGVWGTFVFFWYHRFFTRDLFALGRLQYHRRPFPLEDYKGILHKDDTVYSCHIPACGPLRTDDVMDSLKRAYEFFKDELRDGILPVYCSSWLLYPTHAELLFPEGSNLKKFYELFDIVEHKANPRNSDFFRMFGVHYSYEVLKNVEADTTLKRNFKEYLLKGNCMGTARGIILFDGEKIISKHE